MSAVPNLSAVKEAILAKKSALADGVEGPMAQVASRCVDVWPDSDGLDAVLRSAIRDVPHCHLMYAWNVDSIQLSSLVTHEGVHPRWRGRDLSQRPYLQRNLPFKGVMLSSVYLSEHNTKRCITALQAVSERKRLLGFIAADFREQDLPLDAQAVGPSHVWTQYRGDPAVRGTLFMQQRVHSLADEHIDDVLELVETLMREHGVFHSQIHFSSGRCTLWLYDDPYQYQILGLEEVIDSDTCLAYPLRPYPQRAVMCPDQIRPVLEQFKALRLGDETLYLRVGSINVIDGMLGLTFSCDGSHYMPVDDFLTRDLTFWYGPQAAQSSLATEVSS